MDDNPIRSRSCMNLQSKVPSLLSTGESGGRETEYPFLGVQPKVITDEIIRPMSQRNKDIEDEETPSRGQEDDLAAHSPEVSMSHLP
jgi:hypothetical protein